MQLTARADHPGAAKGVVALGALGAVRRDGRREGQ